MNQTDAISRVTTDVLIVGGGAVGMALAIGLAKLNKKVILIDKNSITDEQRQQNLTKRDARVYALNLTSLKLFADIGADDFVRRADYTHMQVWQGDGRGMLHFGDDDFPQVLGSMVEPSVIDDALIRRAKQADIRQHLTILQGASLNVDFGLDVHHHGVRAMVRHDDRNIIIDTALLVGADGRASTVRQMAGIGIDRLDYQQTAICCAILTDKPHTKTARQAMLPTGTLALLPLADLCSEGRECWQSVVWTLPSHLATDYLALDPQALADKLALASGFELGRIHAIESIASFPLSAQVAKSYTAPHTLLIGDAAHGVHPLAGQGLNLGLADVAQLLTLVDKGASGDRLLRQYERARCAHNALMMHSFSMINYAFAGELFQQEPMRFIRSEVVNLTGKIRPLMRFFQHKASGLT